MARIGPGSDSMNAANSAPRESASRPTAPLPANPSRTREPSTNDPRILKTAWRTLASVARMAAGTTRVVPLNCPPVILAITPYPMSSLKRRLRQVVGLPWLPSQPFELAAQRRHRRIAQLRVVADELQRLLARRFQKRAVG